MSYLTDKKASHEREFEEAFRDGDFPDAVFHAAKISEFCYQLAKQAEGRIAESYIEAAEGWLDVGENLRKKGKSLAQKPARNGSAAGSAGGKAAAKPGNRREGAEDQGSGESDWVVTEKPDVTFDDIAGMEEAKETIRQMIVHPIQNREKARAIGVQAGGGVLMFGPPGNGKTTLAKAIAHDVEGAFLFATGATIRSKWHGESEQKLKALLDTAKSFPVAVLLLDDIDGLLPKRGGNSVVDNRIVVEFLNQIGGFKDSENTLLILGATNNPWDIDEAVFRTGRFDEKLYIPPPDEPARFGILKRKLEGVPVGGDLDLAAIAAELVNYTGSDVVGIVNTAKRAAFSRSIKDDCDPVITAADIEAAIRKVPSSITDAMLNKYQKFNELRFG